MRWQDAIPPTTPASIDVAAGTCGYQTFAGAYDADWEAILAKPIGIDHRAVVCLDPDGLGIQLTGVLENMRPLVLSRDVRFQEYQGQDVDFTFADPDGRLDPAVSGSLLDGVAWEGLKIFIGSWLVGTARVLEHAVFYLEDVRAAEGVVVFRCKDAFARLQDTQVRANLAITIAETSVSGTGNLADVEVKKPFAPIEIWTLTFTSTTHFRARGSISGDDGEGDTTGDFTSDSGAIKVLSSDWSGTWAEGDTVTFRAVAQYSGNLFTAGRTILVENTDLSEDDLDQTSWDAAPGSFSLHDGTFTQRTATDALTLLRLIMRHGPATAYPNHEGKIAIAFFHPQLGTSGVDGSICGTWDLESLETERNIRYTHIVVNYAPDASGDLTLSQRWPRTDGNLPLEVNLPGFGSGDGSIVDFVAQRYFAIFEEAREIYTVDLLLQDLNRLLEDVVYLDSRFPNRTTYGQIIKIEKDLTADSIQAKLFDVSWLVQPEGACGYAFCDVGHRCDDCWICW